MPPPRAHDVTNAKTRRDTLLAVETTRTHPKLTLDIITLVYFLESVVLISCVLQYLSFTILIFYLALCGVRWYIMVVKHLTPMYQQFPVVRVHDG